jgi:hypothetical protein
MSVAASAGVLSELGQYVGVVPGTFDKIDVCFYLIGALCAVLTVGKGNADG